jgi:hypothetical protein
MPIFMIVVNHYNDNNDNLAIQINLMPGNIGSKGKGLFGRELGGGLRTY